MSSMKEGCNLLFLSFIHVDLGHYYCCCGRLQRTKEMHIQ